MNKLRKQMNDHFKTLMDTDPDRFEEKILEHQNKLDNEYDKDL